MGRQLRGGGTSQQSNNDGGSLSSPSSSLSSSTTTTTTTGMLRRTTAIDPNTNNGDDDTKLLSDKEYASLLLQDWDEEEEEDNNSGNGNEKGGKNNNNTNKGGGNNGNNNNKNNNNKGGNNNKGSGNTNNTNNSNNNNASQKQNSTPTLVKGTENKNNNSDNVGNKNKKSGNGVVGNNSNNNNKNQQGNNGNGTKKGGGNNNSVNVNTKGGNTNGKKKEDDEALPKGGKRVDENPTEVFSGANGNNNDENASNGSNGDNDEDGKVANGAMEEEDAKIKMGEIANAPARARDEDDALRDEDDAFLDETADVDDDAAAAAAAAEETMEAEDDDETETVKAAKEQSPSSSLAFGELGEVARKEEGSLIVDDPVLGAIEVEDAGKEEEEAAEEVEEGSSNGSSDESNTVEVAPVVVVDASKGDDDNNNNDDTIDEEDDAVDADDEKSVEKEEVDVEETNAQSNLEEELEGSGNAVTDDVESESDGNDGEELVGEEPEEESPEEESKSKQIEIEAGDDDEEGIEGVEEGIKKGIEEGANDDEKSGDGVWSDDDDDATAAQEASDEDDEVAKVAGEDATEEVEEEVGATGEVTTGALLEGALDDILLSEVAPAADGDAEGATEDAAGVVAGNVAGDVNVDAAEDANAKSDWSDDDDDDDDTAIVAEDANDPEGGVPSNADLDNTAVGAESESGQGDEDDDDDSVEVGSDDAQSQTETPDGNSNVVDAVGEKTSDGDASNGAAKDAVDDAAQDEEEDAHSNNSNGGKVGIVKLKYEKALLSLKDPSALGIGGGDSFDNLRCLDDRDDCGDIVERGMCGDELFSVDVPASLESDVVAEVHEGEGVVATGAAGVGGAADGAEAKVAGSGEGTGVVGVVGGASPAKDDTDDDDDDDDDGNAGGAVEVAAGVGEGSPGNLRMEEEVAAAASSDDDDDDDDDAGDRRLEDGKSAWGDDDDDVDAGDGSAEVADIEADSAEGSDAEIVSAPAPSESSTVVVVVTTGSRHCPVSCDMVKECERARDHYHPESSISDKVVLPEAEPEVDAEDAKGAENSVGEKGEVIAADDNDDTASKATKDVVTVDEAAEEPAKDVGGNEISAGKEAQEVIAEVDAWLERNGGGDSVSEGEQTSNANEEPSTEAPTTSEGATTEEEAVCEDDTSFLYKDKAGFDCAFIAANKPEKCSKLHDGKKVGAVSCPRSCDMVEECEALKTIGLGDGDVLENDEGAVAGGGVGDTEDQSPGIETGGSDNEAEGVETVSEGAIIVNATVEGQHSIGEYAANTNIESSHDDGPSEFAGNATAVVEPICEDDPAFLYKDKPGFTCAFLAANKPDKCSKLHDGEKVGAVSCPRSCDMVKECEDMYNVSGSVVEIDDIVRGDSVDAVPSDEEDGNEDAGEDVGGVTEERGCDEDDPSFLYHDKPGHDCSFLAEHKPAKCEKLGVTHCPKSCNMTEECEAAKELDESGSQTTDEGLAQVGMNSVNVTETAVAGSDIGNDIYNSDNAESQSESGGLNDNGVNVTETAVAGSDIGNESYNSDNTGVQSESSVLTDNGWSADSEDQSTAESNIESVTVSSSCKDDPSFLYKNKEGFTCQFVGTMKPDKCTKLHNGVEIGIASCPESCNMVAKCLEAEASAGEEAESSSNGVGGETVAEGGEEGIKAGVDEDGAYTDDEVGGSLQGTYHIGDVASGESPNQGEGANVGGGTTVGTKSMMDEIDKGNDGGSFAGVVLGQSSGDGPITESPEFGGDVNGNTSNGSDIGLGAGMEEGKGENNTIDTVANDDDEENDEGELEYNDDDSNDDGAALDDNVEWGFMENEGSNNLDGTGSGSEGNASLEQGGQYTNNEWGSTNDSSLGANTQNSGSTEIGGYEGGDNTFNDNKLSEEEADQFNNAVSPASNVLDNDVAATPSTNTLDENLEWDDFDDDGFPGGLFLALLVIFIFFVYRKSTQRNQQECTTRGGYQPVQSGDHNKRY